MPVHEVFFVHDTDALGGKGGLREVTVVGLVVSAQTEFPVLGEQPDSFEVTYKVGITHGIFTVAEVTVDYQSVVQQTAGQDGFGFYIAPAFFSGSKVGTYVPVLVVDDLRKHIVQLARQSAEGQRAGSIGLVGIVGIVVGVEFADSQQVNNLGVHLFFGAGETTYQFAVFFTYCGQFEAKRQVG